MNQMRDRLIELITEAHCVDTWDCNTDDFKEPNPIEALADYLLDNGVIVPPCKVGDVVYYITGIHGRIIKEAKIEEIYCSDSGFAYHVSSDYLHFDMQQYEIYFTKEEAEAALKEREQG